MKRDEMFKLVCELLRDSPELEGTEITDETNPFTDLGKDSHDGIVFACLLSERLGIELGPELNPLVDDEHQRARRVVEVVDWCLERLQTKAKEE
jgi:acyl carrier protein